MATLRTVVGVLLALLVTVGYVFAVHYITTHPRASIPRRPTNVAANAPDWPSVVTHTIQGFSGPCRLVALPRRVRQTCYVYVANSGSNTVSVIDTHADEVAATINCDARGETRVLETSAVGDLILVGNREADAPLLCAIQPIARSRQTNLTLPAGCGVVGPAYIYLADAARDALVVVPRDRLRRKTSGEPFRLELDEPCADLALSPDGRTLYAALADGHKIAVLDLLADPARPEPPQKELPLSGRPCEMALAQDGSRLYASLIEGRLAVVDLNAGTTKKYDLAAAEPEAAGLALTPKSEYVYVCNRRDNAVSVFSTETDEVVALIPVGAGPCDVAVTPDYKVYVANLEDDTVSVIEYQPSAGDQPHAEGTPRNGPGSQTIAGHGAR